MLQGAHNGGISPFESQGREWIILYHRKRDLRSPNGVAGCASHACFADQLILMKRLTWRKRQPEAEAGNVTISRTDVLSL